MMRVWVSISLFLLVSLSMIGMAWWYFGDYRYQSPVDWQGIELDERVDSRKIKNLLENNEFEFDIKPIEATSEYVYELVIGRYNVYENARHAQQQVADIVGTTTLKQNTRGLWELRSLPIDSRNRVDLINIQLGRMQITPQQIRRKVSPQEKSP